jgi:hypothetical protein
MLELLHCALESIALVTAVENASRFAAGDASPVTLTRMSIWELEEAFETVLIFSALVERAPLTAVGTGSLLAAEATWLFPPEGLSGFVCKPDLLVPLGLASFLFDCCTYVSTCVLVH